MPSPLSHAGQGCICFIYRNSLNIIVWKVVPIAKNSKNKRSESSSLMQSFHFIIRKLRSREWRRWPKVRQWVNGETRLKSRKAALLTLPASSCHTVSYHWRVSFPWSTGWSYSWTPQLNPLLWEWVWALAFSRKVTLITSWLPELPRSGKEPSSFRNACEPCSGACQAVKP